MEMWKARVGCIDSGVHQLDIVYGMRARDDMGDRG